MVADALYACRNAPVRPLVTVIAVGIISLATAIYCNHEAVTDMPIRVAVLENGRTKSGERSMESLRCDSTEETGDALDLC
jgi:uncharacterized protein (DUF302 family)